MNINELGQAYEILPVVHEVVAHTEEVSGKAIEFELALNLSTDGSTKIARERMPNHIVKLKESSTHRVNHIIAHECCHIIRIMQAEHAARVVPSSNAISMASASEALAGDMEAIPFKARKEVFEIWVSGLISQLINLPVDVRIERYLYDNYPALREAQIRSLAVDVKNSLGGISDNIRQGTAESVFNKSNAMVYAYLRGVSEITGENYAPHFKRFPDIKKVGRKLYSCLEVEDKGFDQDVEIINVWAEILQIKTWFAWIGFEDVPISYYE